MHVAFDDALYGLLIRPQYQARSAFAMYSANANYIREHSLKNRELLESWVKERVICLALLTASCFIAFNPQATVRSLGYREEDTIRCYEFLDDVGFGPTRLSAAFAALDKIVTRASWKSMLHDFVCGSGFIMTGYYFWLVVMNYLFGFALCFMFHCFSS
jgi:hypothetical protein